MDFSSIQKMMMARKIIKKPMNNNQKHQTEDLYLPES